MATSYASTINSLYLAYYGRPADPAGLDYWVQQLERANGDFGGIVDAFARSDEATAHFQSAGTADHIAQIYQQLFNRAPDAAGLAYWTGLVDKGSITLANAAAEILQGARETDLQLSTLRQQAADIFTAQVRSGGTDYSGYASIEAAHVLVKAVTLGMSADDLQAVTKAAVTLADIATKAPAVVDAIATGTTLTALLDTARGAADPVGLVQTLANVAEAAAGNPATLDSLLRGGGMQKVLTVMPSSATLPDVAHALEQGGLPAAVEVVYPSAPAPTFDVSVSGGELTISGTAHDDVVVNLSTDTVTRAGATVALNGDHIDLTDALATGYAGKVTIAGSAAEVAHAMQAPSGVKAYDITDAKSAIFSGEPGARTFVSDAVAQLVDGAHSLKITDTLSAEERALLGHLPHFNPNALDASVDAAAPAPGVLSVHGLDITGAGTAAGVTNDDSFTLSLSGAEEGATVKYEVAHGGSGQWTTVASTAGLDSGSYHYRAVVTDAAGNVSTSNVIDVTIDKTAPVITGFALGENDGKLAIGEPVSFSVTFSKVVDVHGTPAIALNNGAAATYTSGTGSDTLVFTYTPQAGQSIDSLATAIGHALSGQITDEVGNAVATTAFDNLHPTQPLLVDGVAPTTTITIDTVQQDGGNSPDVAADFVTNQANAALHATLSAPLAGGEHVEYSVDGVHWSVTHAIDGAGVTLSGIDTTTSPTVSLRVVDAAGNAGQAASQHITFDGQAPVNGVTFNSISEDEGGSPDTHADFVTNQHFATVHATLDAAPGEGDYVQFSVDGLNWITANSNGIVSSSIEGVHGQVNGADLTILGIDVSSTSDLSVRVVDAAGNATQAASQHLTYDTVAPTTTATFTALTEDSGSTPDGHADFVTNQPVATVTATLSAALADGEYVQYSLGDGGWQTVGAQAGGPLPSVHVGVDGATVTFDNVGTADIGSISLRVVDAAGNAGAATAQSITFDNSAPTVIATIASITEDSGNSPDTHADFVTNQQVADVRVNLSAPLGAGDYVQYSLDGGQTWSAENVDVNANSITIGNVQPPLILDTNLNLMVVNPLAGTGATSVTGSVTIHGIDTTHNPVLEVRVVDAAGNEGGIVSQQITYDGAAPDVGAIAYSQVTQGANDVKLDNVTNVTLANVDFVYTGNDLGSGETFQYSLDGVNWSSANVDVYTSTNTVRVKGLDLSHGAFDGANLDTTVSLRAVDAAGNATAVVSKTIVYDNHADAPQVSLTNDSAGPNGTGADAVTNNAAWTLSGVETGAKVEYSADGVSHWSATAPTAVEGGNSFYVHQTDQSGNVSGATHVGFQLDTHAPAAPTVALASDTGVSATDGITNSGIVNLGNLEGGGAAWQWSLDGGGHWTTGQNGSTQLDLGSTGDGAKDLLVRQVDVAGNAGEAASLHFTLDTSAPTAATLSFSAVEQATTDANVTELTDARVYFKYDGTLDSDAAVQWRLADGDWTNVNSASIDTDTHTIMVGPINLSSSDPTVEMRIVDAAGNQGSAVSQFIDGPYSFQMTAAAGYHGIDVTSTGNAGMYLVDPLTHVETPVLSSNGGGAVNGSVVVGSQAAVTVGEIELVTANGASHIDATATYTLGTDNADVIGGQHLYGFGGNDHLIGTGGADTLNGGTGNDLLTGGGGHDTFVFADYGTGDGSDVITDFTPGVDQIDISAPGFVPHRAIGIDTTLYSSLDDLLQHNGMEDGPSATMAQVGHDVYLLVDSDHTHSIQQGTGDTIVKLQDVSLLDMTANNFTGNLTFQGAWTGNGTVLDGTSASDTLSGGYVRGLDGNDDITGTTNANYLFGGAGNDHIHGGGGGDYIVGGAGADNIDLGQHSGPATLVYAAGDTATGLFMNGGSTAGMDVISSLAAGDALQLGAVFNGVAVAHDSFLTDASANQYAIVRGTDAGGAFVTGAADSNVDYMVQWSDGANVNSVVLHDYGTLAPTFTVQGGSLVLDMPPEPVGVETQQWIDGVMVAASAPGEYYMVDANGVLQSQLPLQGSVENTMYGPQFVLGAQHEASSGFIEVKVGSQIGIDTHINYALGTDNADELIGNTVYGYGGDDHLVASALQQSSMGDGGPAILVGGAGDDTMTGNHGMTVFQLGVGSGTDTITNFAPGMDELYVSNPFAAAPELQNSYLGRSTTLYQSLDQFISDVNAHNLVPDNATGVTIGQVGQDTYVLVNNDGNFGTITSGSDSIVKLQGVSVLDVDWNSIRGINEGDLHQWGDGSINGTPASGGTGGGGGAGAGAGDPGGGIVVMPLPASTLVSASYVLDDGMILLNAAPGMISGFGNSNTFSMVDVHHGVQLGNQAFEVSGGALSTAYPLPVSLYHMSWQGDTFVSSIGGGVASGDLSFAGGVDELSVSGGSLIVRGFAVATPTWVDGMQYSSANEVNSNDALLVDNGMSAFVHTGGGNDVVSIETCPVTLSYDAADSSASDLVLGFRSGLDSVQLANALATPVDADHNGTITWMSGANGVALPNGTTEGVEIAMTQNVVMGSLSYAASMLSSQVNMSGTTLGQSILVLVNGADQGALYLYHNVDGNSTIDAGELTEIAVFSGGAPHHQDIVVVGTASSGGIPG